VKKIRNGFYKILRVSERYTQTDMVYLTKGGFWLISGQIFSMIATFFLSIGYANLLPQDAYGNYKFVITLTSIIGAFSLTGINNALVQATVIHGKNFLKDFLKISIRWSVLSIAIFIAIAIYYFINRNFLLGTSMAIISICNPLISGFSLYRSFLNGQKNFRLLNRLSVVETVFSSLVIFITILLSNSALVLISVYFISRVFINKILFSFVNYKFSNEEELKDGELINMSKHWSFMRIISIIATKIDEIIIFHFLGAVQLAIYVFSLAIPNQMVGLFKHLYTLSLPKFVKSKKRSNVFSKSLKIFLITLPIALAYVIIAPPLFNTFFPKYTDSIIFTQVFSILILFGGSNINVAYIDAKREVATNYKVSIIADTVKIFLMLCLLIPFGLWGLIVGKVLGKTFGYVLSLYYAIKLEKSISLQK
jgi:O-antigen/teichoic acid export membrane protein